MNMHWYLICNASAGQGRARSILQDLQVQLSEQSIVYTTHETQSEGDGLRIGKIIAAGDVQPENEILVAVIGGDGTLHEVINGIATQSSSHQLSIKLVIIPTGTANAVYHSLFPSTASDPENMDRFLSVKAALSSASSPAVPLSILKVTPSPYSETAIFCHVVTSTSLHAHLLETASTPKMRASFPGTERFQKAAEQHMGTVYQAELTLYPFATDNGTIQRWSVKKMQWQTVSQQQLVIRGGFTYFVSALVDRFEAKFRIAPHSSIKDRPRNAIDVILVREKPGQGRQEAANELTKILSAAFDDGKHISLTAPAEGGDEHEIRGDGQSMVEYYRTGGFDWEPVSNVIMLNSTCCPETTHRS